MFARCRISHLGIVSRVCVEWRGHLEQNMSWQYQKPILALSSVGRPSLIYEAAKGKGELISSIYRISG